jgi:hypothetical protein
MVQIFRIKEQRLELREEIHDVLNLIEKSFLEQKRFASFVVFLSVFFISLNSSLFRSSYYSFFVPTTKLVSYDTSSIRRQR